MCGRYTSTIKAEVIKERFGVSEIQGDLKLPRFNIAPTQLSPVVISESSKRILTQFQWGLIPFWSKDASLGNKMINARAETLLEKKSFSNLLKKNRCLVISDGFYEWIKEGANKYPVRILLKSREPFAFAGLWDQWKSPNNTVIKTFTIVTTTTKDHTVMEPIHDRMPVILTKENEDEWLESSKEPHDLVKKSLKQFPAEEMEFYAVSKAVNSPRNDTVQCIEFNG
ncbi:MAG: hypothetical protein A3I11_02920 [Elusimicrobia bacterium RIFCSPLOWO2_02_FULL_39_32]|nr:MAG: hypothetical protein A3I11_02920 [Elusimicrobia bacterium RIFCSPLOWO2_02_FULL_39_32]OGS00497.1 MAG: hypothetical protein A3G85_09350 [Elusimicrobia bacterium RIFCSPLOWO2_12_FULL_39_28]